MYTGRLAGSELRGRIQSFAGSGNQILQVLGEPQLRHVVALPYLDQIFLSGDLLLVPEGSGHYLSEPIYDLFSSDGDPGVSERSVMFLTARAWLLGRFPADPSSFGQVSPEGDRQVFYFVIPKFYPETWAADHGRWVQLPEVPDMAETYISRRQASLNPWGERAVVAFWLAMELSAPDVRQEDLNLVQAFHHDTRPGYGLRYQRMSQRKMPYFFETPQARRLLWGLHLWTEAVGQDQALAWAAQALHEDQSEAVSRFLARLGQLSGVEVKESEP
jgi:hypothetical protein